MRLESQYLLEVLPVTPVVGLSVLYPTVPVNMSTYIHAVKAVIMDAVFLCFIYK